MIKVILFDADGMLVITEMFSVQYCRESNVPYEEILLFFKNEFSPCLIGQADLKEKVSPYLEKWGWNKSVEEFLEYWFESENHIDHRVVKVIKELREKGIKCCLLTNQEKYKIEFMRERMNFAEIFDRVFSSAEAGAKKPSPEIFEYVTRELGDVKKEEIMLWDDKEKNVRGAEEFGFKASIYKDFESFKKEIDKIILYGNN